MAYTLGRAAEAVRREPRARLQRILASQAARAQAQGVTGKRADTAVDEALREIRRRPD